MDRLATFQDNGSHSPPEGAPDTWQESFFLSWYDPRTESGGYHHLDVQPSKGRTCLWSWIAARGCILSRYQSLNMAPLTGDLANFTAGPLRVATLTPLQAYRIEVAHPGASERGTCEDVEFRAFTKPLYLAMDETGDPILGGGKVGVSDYQSNGAGHYENIGAVEGVITAAGGERIEVRGYGMQDHSWGPREYGNLTGAHRFVHATFGPDLFASLYAMAKGDQLFHYGYVHDAGTFHRVSALDIDVVVGKDGHTPKSLEVSMWSATGRGYCFTGVGRVGSVSTHDGGFFSTDVCCEFRMGGRRGAGLIALRERAAPTPREREWLQAFEPKSL